MSGRSFFYLCLMEVQRSAWVALGSNMGDRFANLQSAIDLMPAYGAVPVAVSRVYETAPEGFSADTDFLNAVVQIHFTGRTSDLLSRLLELERRLGRNRTGKEGYQSRPIDLDILLAEKELINTPGLTLPHPRMTERKFVLYPLNDLIPAYIHPVHGWTVNELQKRCIDKNVPLVHHKALSVNH